MWAIGEKRGVKDDSQVFLSFSAGGSGRDGEAEGAGALGSVSEAPVGVHRQLVMSRIGEKFKKTSLCYS